MDSKQILLLIVVAVVLLIIGKMVYDGTSRKKKLLQRIRREYGTLPKNDYSALRYQDQGIRHYYNNKEKKTPVIDDITWNDLDMETVYMILNNTSTGIGEEYLYALLHMPCMDEEVLQERDRVAKYFDSHEQERVNVQYELLKLGKLKTSSVGQYLSGIRSMRPHKPTLHLVCLAALIVSIMGCIVRPEVWLPVIILVVVFNMVVYFKRKADISSYFVVFSYLSRMNQSALKISELHCSGISGYCETLKKCARPLASISRYSWLFVTGTDLSADLLAIFMDYVKMMTHFDLILFDYLAYRLFKYGKELDTIMDTIGEIDCAIAIASYRRYMSGQQGTPVCTPVLHKDGPLTIKTEHIYHPMIINPVTNSLDETKSVLLTGSNASGKSTFLKTVAINAILAQTIYTCLADSYESRFFRIYSSMALQDNIQSSESYYIVEIKSLKRIVDAAAGKPEDGAKPLAEVTSDGAASQARSAAGQAPDEQNYSAAAGQASWADVPVMCFIDEVLRGTNTIERIAASSRILDALAHMNALCFAATHDIELTTILEKSFSNYHFQEEVSDNDVTFDYILYPGRATSRNAIKLLGMIGFDKAIIEEATMAARDFESLGSWAPMENQMP